MAMFEFSSESEGYKRRQRQKEAADITHRLIQTTEFDPAEINKVVANYVKTGNLELPTTRIGAIPPKIGMGPSNQGQVPIQNFRQEQDIFTLGPDGMMHRGSVQKGSRVIDQTRGIEDSANQDVWMYDEQGNLVKVGSVPRKSRVVAKPQPKPEDPLAALLKDKNQSDLKAKAKKLLEENGAPVTEANIQAVIERKLVE